MAHYYFLDDITCVRWNPSGDLLASTSWDGSVKAIDFKTGKIIVRGESGIWGKLFIFLIHN